MPKVIQQGDVLFIPIKELPKEAKKVASKEYHTMAVGEHTGYAHQIPVKEADFYKTENKSFVKLCAEVANVYHRTEQGEQKEHKPKVLDAPLYEVKIIREYDYDLEQARSVQD